MLVSIRHPHTHTHAPSEDLPDMNVLVVIDFDLAKVVDTISNFFSSILNELVGINNLQIIQQVEIMDIIIVLELESTNHVITSFSHRALESAKLTS